MNVVEIQAAVRPATNWRLLTRGRRWKGRPAVKPVPHRLPVRLIRQEVAVKLSTLTLLFLVCLVTAASRAEAQTKAYIVSAGANVVTVVDTASASVTGTVPVGANPSHVAISRDGTRAYVSNT